MSLHYDELDGVNFEENPWTAIATTGDYTLWSRDVAAEGKAIYVLLREQPTPTSGGYYTIDAALKVKGIKAHSLSVRSAPDGAQRASGAREA